MGRYCLKEIALPWAILIALVGCSHTPEVADLPCPVAPELVGIPVEKQQLMEPETLEIVVNNMILLMQYAERLEARLGCK